MLFGSNRSKFRPEAEKTAQVNDTDAFPMRLTNAYSMTRRLWNGNDFPFQSLNPCDVLDRDSKNIAVVSEKLYQ